MGKREVERGPTAERVAANVRRIRRGRDWTLQRLSDELTKVGRPILSSGIGKIELGERRVDVDDLVALAVVLRVHPAALLLPYTTDGEIQITSAEAASALDAWRWAEGQRPLFIPPEDDGEAAVDFQDVARPPKIRRFDMTTPAGQRHMRAEYPGQAERYNALPWEDENGYSQVAQAEKQSRERDDGGR